MLCNGVISIHAPREGRDQVIFRPNSVFADISIHAPREGRDQTPIYCFSQIFEFQSTRPARGATELYHDNFQNFKFQSTRPARGATFLRLASSVRKFHFNPRAPRGARQKIRSGGKRTL